MGGLRKDPEIPMGAVVKQLFRCDDVSDETVVPLSEQIQAIWSWAEAKTSGAEGELSAELHRLFPVELGTRVRSKVGQRQGVVRAEKVVTSGATGERRKMIRVEWDDESMIDMLSGRGLLNAGGDNATAADTEFDGTVLGTFAGTLIYPEEVEVPERAYAWQQVRGHIIGHARNTM